MLAVRACLTNLTNYGFSPTFEAMAAYNIYEAKTGLSALVEKAVAGEEVIIARAGRPLVKMIPVEQVPPKEESKYKRPAPGAFAGEFTELIAALDEPWDEEEQRAFGMID